MAKFRVYVSTNKVGSESETDLEIDDEDFKNMSEKEFEDQMREVMFEMIEWNYERID